MSIEREWRSGSRIAPAIAMVAVTFCCLQRCSGLECDEIVRAWQERQSRIKTVQATWEQSCDGIYRWSPYQSAWRPKDASSLLQPGHALKIHAKRLRYETNRWYHRIDLEYAGYFSPLGVEFVAGRSDPFYRLHLQPPSSIAFETARQGQFSNPTEQYHDAWRLTSIFDGERWTDIFEKPKSSPPLDKSRLDAATHSEAVIRGVKLDKPLPFSQIMEDLIYRPLLLLYRPFDPALGGCRAANWKLNPKEFQIDGQTCRMISEPGDAGWEHLFFIDPQRQFVVLRYIVQEHRQTRAQIDIRYQADLTNGPVPASWTSVLFSDQTDFPGQNNMPFFSTVEVTSFTLNESLTDSDFQPKPIPVDTLVTDQTLREVYITRLHGKRRIVTRAEMSESDADFVQVAATSAGYAPRRSPHFSPTRWLMVLTGGTFGCALLLTLLKRTRDRYQSNSSASNNPAL